jgi:NodT family efflux transporter outer membrane factor (OMF) lipoprotein
LAFASFYCGKVGNPVNERWIGAPELRAELPTTNQLIPKTFVIGKPFPVCMMNPTQTAFKKIAQWLLLLLLIGGCADRSFQRASLPALETPAEFAERGTSISPNRWWSAFGDANLDFQVDSGLCNNYSVLAAAQRVRAARAVTRREASDFWPDIDGILGLGFNGGPNENSESYSLGLDINYPVDLWGEIESRVEAQRLRANATCWDYHAGALALSAEITSVWFSLIEAHAQAELLEEQIKTNETGLKLQEERFGLGFVRSADVLRQRQLLESTLEQAVVIESQINVLEHQLAVLLGRVPQGASFEPGTAFPELPPLPATGLPSELLLRRPDIQRNYNALAAADRDLASAISRQYPRLNLSASLQNLSENPGDLLKNWFVSLGGQLIAPLFDGGQRKAEVERTNAVKYALFHEYAQSVLLAYQEVEDSLVQEKFQIQRIEHLEEQVKLAGQASDQLREQYLIGDAQYLDVLNAITGQQRLQRQLLNAQLDLRLIRVSLYLALAGNLDPTCVPPGFTSSEIMPLELELEDFEVEESNTENVSNNTQDKLESANESLSADENLGEGGGLTIGSDEPNYDGGIEKPPMSKSKDSILDRLRGTADDE